MPVSDASISAEENTQPSNSGVHYFGIRHHGPGSAKRLLGALNRLQPSKVLIEGPADCGSLLPMLARHEMKPPVALLAYAAEHPACSFYYPFADYSPEYQASCWAVDANAELLFIDLPACIQLAQALEQEEQNEQKKTEATTPEQEPASEQDEHEGSGQRATPEGSGESEIASAVITNDPIGTLAKLAGYEDGEAWWNDLIEQNCDSDQEIFTTVESAMTELRRQWIGSDPTLERDLLREAHMRLEIAKAAKTAEGPIAVVCGAWHVPALREKHTAKADRELLKKLPGKLPQSKVKTTWVPWTSPRLASASGYGAGVAAPMWYQHLWQHRDKSQALEHWLAQITQVLRENDYIISTASVIEAVRLSTSLAAVRNRPQPGFEEIREAVLACLCFGEAQVWQQLEQKILLGNQVGEIPADVPLAPLLEDLQRLQKKHKLKPEALQRELSLDLRSAAGLGKSVLLHRLAILEVPWGSLGDSGSSRGTFRERWQLCWQPEYSVRLIENLPYGSTIEQAAGNKISELLSAENDLSQLAETVQLCLESQLNSAADLGLARLENRAAHTSDCIELLKSLPPLVNVNRYGTARDISLGHIEALIGRLATQAALALPYACRNLDDEEAQHYRHCIGAGHQALELAQSHEFLMQNWWGALHTIVESSQSSLQVAGLCARLLYQAKEMPADHLQDLLQRILSPALPAIDAARFFDGFFTDAVQRLLYDDMLRNTLEQWLISLDEQAFVEFLPLFRRIFSDLDAMERKHLLDTVLQGRSQTHFGKKVNPATLPLWPEHLQRIGRLIKREKDWTQ